MVVKYQSYNPSVFMKYTYHKATKLFYTIITAIEFKQEYRWGVLLTPFDCQKTKKPHVNHDLYDYLA